MNIVSTKNQQLGGLYVHSPQGEQLVFPLKHTEVIAKMSKQEKPKRKKSAPRSPKLAAPIHQQLEVISITGLDEAASI